MVFAFDDGVMIPYVENKSRQEELEGEILLNTLLWTHVNKVDRKMAIKN